jgi:hypothetical protein
VDAFDWKWLFGFGARHTIFGLKRQEKGIAKKRGQTQTPDLFGDKRKAS